MMSEAMTEPQYSVGRGEHLKLHRRATSGEVSIWPLQPQTPAKPPAVVLGTGLAVSNISLGVGPHLPVGAVRGGARNRADRESHELSAAQIANLLAAAAHARRIGLPFTRMVSIHWEAAGVPLGGMATATGRYIDLLSKALSRHGSATAWLWVHENGRGKGGHCHLLAHVPPTLVKLVTGLQRRWLRRITRHPYRARVILCRPIGGRLGLEVGNPDLYLANFDAALSYCLKGVCSQAAPQFGLDRIQPGGRIIGKRCGTSQNIGPKARRSWKQTQ